MRPGRRMVLLTGGTADGVTVVLDPDVASLRIPGRLMGDGYIEEQVYVPTQGRVTGEQEIWALRTLH